MTILGTKLASAPASSLSVTAASGNQVATSHDGTIVAPSLGWLTHLGAWLEIDSGTPAEYIATWDNGTDNAPNLTLGRSALTTIPGSAGNVEAAVADSESEALTAIRVAAGQKLHLGPSVQGGDALLGRSATGSTTLYRKTAVGALPTSPFAHDAQATGTPLAVYAVFVANSPPNAPTDLTPGDESASNDTTPTLGATFSDPDSAAPTSDQLWAYEFEVRDASSQALLWGGATALFAATAAERAAGSYARDYNGTALSGGQEISWTTRAYDLHGQPGPWASAVTLSINDDAQVVTTAPSGKIDGPTDAISWAGNYHHPDAEAATHVQVRVLKDGLVYREGPEVAKAISSASLPGTAFTLTANEAGLGLLGAGLGLTAQMRAKADGVWGLWSPAVPFSTNAIPSVPSGLQPPHGTVSTTRPTLRFFSADPDDTEGTEVQWTVEVTRPDLTTHEYVTTTYDTDTGAASLALTSTHLPSNGEYLFRAMADDVSASDGESEWSDYVQFTYAAGLTVTVTAPTEGATVATATPSVSFTIGAGTLVTRRLIVYAEDTTTPLYDTGVETSASGTFLVPDGILLNETDYDLAVWAENDSAVNGWSLRRRFTVSFTPPGGITGPTLSLYSYEGDPEPTGVLFAWEQSDLPLDRFGGYVVRRRFTGEPFEDAIILKIIRAVGQNRWLDANAPADEGLIYSASILEKVGGQTAESDPVEAEIDLDLTTVVLHALEDPTQRVVLRWKAAPSTRKGSYDQQATPYETWGTLGIPAVVFGDGTQQIIDGTFAIVGDDFGEREEHFTAGESLYLGMKEVMYRDERTHFFGRIAEFSYEQFDFKDTVRLRIEETDFLEGEIVERDPEARRRKRRQQRRKRRQRRRRRRQHN